MRRLLLPSILATVVLAAACSGGSNSSSSGSKSGDGISDEQYLAAICKGQTSYVEALNTKTKAEDIASVLKQWANDMKALNLSGDLKTYNEQYAKFLSDAAASDPTSLVTKTPPLPPSALHSRLAAKESSVPECATLGTFLSKTAPK